MDEKDTGRRLRQRPSQSICYKESNVIEEDEKACRRKQRKNTRKKREARIPIESLYQQENIKFSSTPLETIFELPGRGQGQDVRGKRREEKRKEGDHDDVTSLNDACELNPSMMTKRKFRRLCLFTSHYYPSKNKTRLRKERARFMKQRRGVIVPNGKGISHKDLEMVLSCLSENEEKNENDKNVVNTSCLNINKSGFYVGNIIRPDTRDITVDDIIHNIGTLRVDISNADVGIRSDVVETTLAPMFFDEPVPSMSLNDEPFQSSLSNSREKKLRRRSGRLPGCPLPSVVKTSEEHEIKEQSCTSMQHSILTNTFVLPKVSEEKLQDTLRCEEVRESLTSVGELSGVLHPEQVKAPISNTSKVSQRKESRKERKKKDTDNQSNKPKTVAKKRVRQTETSEQESGLKVCKLKMGIKRTNKTGTVSDVKKRRDSKSHNPEELCAKELSELEMDTKHTKRCEKQLKSKEEKRRVSGINRLLYSTMLELATSDTSGNADLSCEEIKSVAESPINTVEQEASSHSVSVIAQVGASDHSPTVPISDSGMHHHSPVSPSMQMAALSLSADNSPVSTSPTHLKRNVENKSLRRSARLSLGSAVSQGLAEKPILGLGTYWCTSFQSCDATKDVNAAENSSHAPEGNRSPIQSPHTVGHGSQLITSSNSESARGRKTKAMISIRKGRGSSGSVCKQDLIIEANRNAKASDAINSDNVKGYHTAGIYGNLASCIESDGFVPPASTENNSVCDDHPSRVLTDCAKVIVLPLQSTCKDEESSIISVPR